MGARDDHCRKNKMMQAVMNFPETKAEKARKRRHDERKTSSYRGIRFVRRGLKKPWRAEIYYQGQQLSLGNFATETDAATAYDAKALKLISKDPLYKPQPNFSGI